MEGVLSRRLFPVDFLFVRKSRVLYIPKQDRVCGNSLKAIFLPNQSLIIKAFPAIMLATPQNIVGSLFINPIIITMGKNQHVTPRPGGGWQVKGAGNEKATKITNTQKQAINAAIPIAKVFF